MWGAVHALLEDAVDQGIIPGCALCVRSADAVLHSHAIGDAQIRPYRRNSSCTTPYDLASLTKVLATTPVAMALVAAGRLDLDAEILETIPGAPAGVTAAHCLSHSSGLPAWKPLWKRFERARWGQSRHDVLWEAFSAPVVAGPGEAYTYSDLGFLLLLALLERLGGGRLDALFDQWVRRPSEIDLRWGWPGAAATEDCPVRDEVIVGEVHDLNACVLDGVSSHAGLFGTAEAVAAAGAWQLRAFHGDRSQGLDPAVVQQFWAHKGAGSHHLGWDGVSPVAGSAGPGWPRNGVGHLGFTGCSIWIAPDEDIVVGFTANRIHPEVEGGAVPDAPLHARYAAFKRLRPALHTAIVEALKEGGRWPG